MNLRYRSGEVDSAQEWRGSDGIAKNRSIRRYEVLGEKKLMNFLKLPGRFTYHNSFWHASFSHDLYFKKNYTFYFKNFSKTVHFTS